MVTQSIIKTQSKTKYSTNYLKIKNINIDYEEIHKNLLTNN